MNRRRPGVKREATQPDPAPFVQEVRLSAMFRPEGAFFLVKMASTPVHSPEVNDCFYDAVTFDEFAREARRLKGVPHSKDAAIVRAMSALGESALAGNSDPSLLLALLDAVEGAIGALWAIAISRPERLRALARKRCIWPVFATSEPGWENNAAKLIADIQLGQECPLSPKFRDARGTDEGWPSRLWAKAAVATVTETLDRLQTYRELRDQADALVATGRWRIAPLPRWAANLTLPPLSKQSLKEWIPLVRQMIREELPGFELHEAWRSVYRTKAQNVIKNSTKITGIVANRILGDICEALKTLAPG